MSIISKSRILGGLLRWIIMLIGSAVGAWFMFKSVFYLESMVTKLFANVPILPFPTVQVFLGCFNILVAGVLVYRLFMKMVASLLNSDRKLISKEMLRHFGIALLLGGAIGIGYLGILILIVNIV